MASSGYRCPRRARWFSLPRAMSGPALERTIRKRSAELLGEGFQAERWLHPARVGVTGEIRTRDPGPFGGGTKRETATAVEVQNAVDLHFPETAFEELQEKLLVRGTQLAREGVWKVQGQRSHRCASRAEYILPSRLPAIVPISARGRG